MKKQFKINILAILFSTNISNFSPINCEEKTQAAIIEKIAEINMQTLPWQQKTWEEKDYHQFLKESVNKRINPTERLKKSTAFEFFQSAKKNMSIKDSSAIKDETIWHDLNFFCGQTDVKKYLAKTISRTYTQLGEISLFCRLGQPTANIKILTKRQNITKKILNNENLMNSLENIFKSIPKSENVFLSFWRQDNFKHASKKFYFDLNGFKWLNKYPNLLYIKSTLGHQQKIGWVTTSAVASITLITYGLLLATKTKGIPEKLKSWAKNYNNSGRPILFFTKKLINKLSQSMTKVIDKIESNRFLKSGISLSTGVITALGIKSNINWTYCCLLIEDCIQKLMIKIAHFEKCMKQLYTIVKNKGLSNVEEFQGLVTFFEKHMLENNDLKELSQLLESNTFKNKSSFFSHKGKILKAYQLMHSTKKLFEEAALSIGAIDMYLSTAKLYKEFKEKNIPICFPQYEVSKKPFIKIIDFWHPLINSKNVVTNSLTIGCEYNRQNIIITGPNAAGKSILMKSIGVSIVTGQSLTIGFANKMLFAPFSLISTHLNITDDIGVGNSRFKAGVIRMEKLIANINNLKPNEFSCFLSDEAFNETTPREGAAVAYSIAEYLSKIENNMCIMSTHFYMLTKLAETTNTFFNYKMSVKRNANGTIKFEYKLEPGISDQHAAIDILRSEGINNEILLNAQKIIQQIK